MALVSVAGVAATVTSSVAPIVAAPTEAVAAASTALVLYDTTGQFGFLGEQYAMLTANLTTQMGTYQALPVSKYTAGMMNSYTGVIYLGSTYDEPIPTAFLDDVLAGTKPVMWLNSNIWQLTNRQFANTGEYWANVRGWDWTSYDTSAISEVVYKGRSLGRYAADQSGVLQTTITDPTKASAVALAKRADGTTFPWATRSGNLTYIGELPMSYMSENNRYLAFADLLFDVLDPGRPERHRALVRIEDVSAKSDPAQLRAVADALAAEKVPFSVTVIPEYRDPTGVFNNGRREVVSLWQKPTLVSALRYMVSKGGTLIMHGWTHQIDGLINPYNQVSGDDFEFFRAHVDANDSVIYDGSVPKDTQSWAANRISKGKTGFLLAGLSTPTIFTPPHYAASAVDYKAIRAGFKARYDRGIYFTGQLAGGAVSTTKFVGQFFPYPVTDIHGTRVVPENIGNEEPDAFNNHAARGPADIVASAAANLVVRDGFASFFWHPYLVGDERVGVAHLTQIVQGIKSLGYTFVSAPSIANAGTTFGLAHPSVAAMAKAEATTAGSGAVRARATQAPTKATPILIAKRKPAEPVINLGEQLVLDPDEGPALTAHT